MVIISDNKTHAFLYLQWPITRIRNYIKSLKSLYINKYYARCSLKVEKKKAFRRNKGIKARRKGNNSKGRSNKIMKTRGDEREGKKRERERNALKIKKKREKMQIYIIVINLQEEVSKQRSAKIHCHRLPKINKKK